MKKRVYLCCSIAVFCAVFACHNTQRTTRQETIVDAASMGICCIPDSTSFLLKQVEQTVHKDSISLIRQLKDLSKEQVKAWIDPIPEKDRYNIETTYKYFKATAFQKKTAAYSSVLLMLIEDLQEDYVLQQQMLITVDPSGKYIDGLPVSYLKNLSNSDVEKDSKSGLYQFSLDTYSRFSGDTIKVYQLADVGKTAQPEADTDSWQELYETIYRINPDGKIVILRHRQKIADERNKK